MASAVPPHQPLQEMMKNLKMVDTSSQLPNSNKEGCPSDATSCISSAGDAIGSLRESDLDHDSAATDQSQTYQTGACYGYYYPGYDGSFWELDDQGYYVAGDGMEFQYPVVQADDGSFMYIMPAFQPGYSPYSPYLPVTAFGVDGQYIGQQPFSPSPMFQPPISSPGYYPSDLPYGKSVPSPYPCDPSFLVGDATYGSHFSGFPKLSGAKSKSNISSVSHTHAQSKRISHSNFSNPSELKSSIKPLSKASQHGSTLQPAASSGGYFPLAKFPLHNQATVGVVYSNSPVSYKANARGWEGREKSKTTMKDNGESDFSFLNEQNHGPRTISNKDALVCGGIADGTLATDENGISESLTSHIRKDQYNLPDFQTKYDHALFFVIKSYSEDDIHKSIKYKVWASTPNGNKRLDTAYEDAQKRMAEKGSKCPVFLFFSVNASGQFCGVAEMIGRVDFNKKMDFWQQDKWDGYFPVKWHIIKDVPNPQLRHIILENNDNKPVTNSRDTQEVRYPQGSELLNIFKNYHWKTSILDDFCFYESRQKVMQEKRIRLPLVLMQKQSVNLSAGDKVDEPRKE